MDIIHWFSDGLKICIFQLTQLDVFSWARLQTVCPSVADPDDWLFGNFLLSGRLAHACNIRDRGCRSIFDRLNTYRQRDWLRSPGAAAAQYPSVPSEFRHNFFGIIFIVAGRKARTLMKVAGGSDFSRPEYFIDGNRSRSRIANQQNEIILCYFLPLII